MNSNSVDQKYNMVKKHHTDTLQEAIDTKKVDEILVPFLLEVTKIPDIFTSSSCCGRIMLLATDEYENKKISSFHKKYHRKVTFDEIKGDLNASSKRDIWFKTEAFIFHFGCKNYLKAKELLAFCQQFGLKKAGIISAHDGKYILEVTSTQYMALPLKENDNILVSDDYLKFVIDRANKKIDVNFERLDKFEKAFISFFKKEK